MRGGIHAMQMSILLYPTSPIFFCQLHVIGTSSRPVPARHRHGVNLRFRQGQILTKNAIPGCN